MTEEILHSRFSPSQADRFFLCPGSVKRIERSPARTSDEYASEGTKAHTLLETCLTHGHRDAWQCISELKLSWHPPDMINAVNEALLYVYELYDELQALFGDAQMYVEVYVNPPVTSAPNEARGKADVVVVSRIGRQVYVIDYKHGVGVHRAAKGNKQVMQYGAGVVYGGSGIISSSELDTVTLVIIQPRSYHEEGEIREYDVTTGQLLDYLIELDNKIEECLEDDAPLVAGYEQCRFCEVKATCPALEKAALNLVDTNINEVNELKASHIPKARELSFERLAYALNSIDLLKLWIKDIETYAKEQALAGFNPPGFKLVHSSTRRQWYGEPDNIAPRLAALIGCPPDDLFEKKFIGITEAEARVKNAFKKRVSKKQRKKAAEDASKSFAYFTTKEASENLTLVPLEDNRPSVNVSKKVFGDVGLKLTKPPTVGD